MDETKIISGMVEGINEKEDRYGIIVAGEWYNKKGKCPIQKGDEVTIEYEINKNFRNIKKITNSISNHNKSETGQTTTNTDERTKDIHYQVCLKIAGNIVANNPKNYRNQAHELAEDVVVLATEMYSRVWGEYNPEK